MTTKKPPVLIRLRPDLKDEIARRAKGQNRSVANFIETVLDEWLRDNPPKEPKK